MDFGLFCSIIDSASAIGVKRVHLYLHGEPMLHPRLVDMIRYIKERGLSLHLTTNGMLMNEKKANELLTSGVDSGDHIIFSVLGSSKEVHENIMRGVKHEVVTENIVRLVEMRKFFKANGPVIEVMFYVMPQNDNEKDGFRKYWRRIVDHARICGKISESFSNYGRKSSPIPGRTQTCSNIWERMTVFWNGEVSLCCEDIAGECMLGNLKTQSIQEIWNSKKLLSIKKLHENKEFDKFPFCYRCDM